MSNVSVNVCVKCKRRHLHVDAVKAGCRLCPECRDIELGIIKRPDGR